jgi:hypothetical protein
MKESANRLFNENTTPDTDRTETELTLLKFRLDQNQSCPHTWSRSQSRRTLVVSRHCFSSSDRRWPNTTTLFDANRSQSWAALSGLTEEKDAIFLLVSYRPSHIHFLRNWSINPFTADVAIMRHLGSAPLSHLCDRRGYTKVIGLSDLNTLSRRVVNGRTCLETIAA